MTVCFPVPCWIWYDPASAESVKTKRCPPRRDFHVGRKAEYTFEQKVQACEDCINGRKNAAQTAHESSMTNYGAGWYANGQTHTRLRDRKCFCRRNIIIRIRRILEMPGLKAQIYKQPEDHPIPENNGIGKCRARIKAEQQAAIPTVWLSKSNWST